MLLPNKSLLIPNPSAPPPPSPSSPKRLHGTRRCSFSAKVEEIRVCTNRTCRRQGSIQTLETLTGVAPPNVAVKSSGCLGRCGAGPNIVALPVGIIVSHCGTAARSAEVLVALCGEDRDANVSKKSLEALALRKKAEIESEKESFSEADSLLS